MSASWRILLPGLAGVGLLATAGCAGPHLTPPMDLEPFSQALRFLGVCSVLCSLIWGISLIVSSRNRRHRRR
jgi:hypothetical protein